MGKHEKVIKKEFENVLDEIFEFSDIPGIAAGIYYSGEMFAAVRIILQKKNYVNKILFVAVPCRKSLLL